MDTGGHKLWGFDGTNWVPLAVDDNGFVKLDLGAVNLGDLGDVSVAAPGDDEFLYWNDAAGEWQVRTLDDGDIPAGIARDAEVADAVSDHADLTDTHGVAGDIVGTDSVQNLRNKSIEGLGLAKIDEDLEGGEMAFEGADNDKVTGFIRLDRYDGDLRFFRNDADADVTLLVSEQFGAGGSVEFETPDLVWKETECHLCGHEFAVGDFVAQYVRRILIRRRGDGSVRDRHTCTVPVCRECFIAGRKPRGNRGGQEGHHA